MSASIGIVGDFNPRNRTHQFTNRALEQLGLGFEWVPTDTIGDEPAARLAGADGVWIAPASPYRSTDAIEDFYCNYGVNPDYRQALEEGGLRVSGLGLDGEIRIVELPDHPFFVATLFLPQARSTVAAPHPLLAGYAAAVA